MINKNKMMISMQSSQEQRYYRSTKYRVNDSGSFRMQPTSVSLPKTITQPIDKSLHTPKEKIITSVRHSQQNRSRSFIVNTKGMGVGVDKSRQMQNENEEDELYCKVGSHTTTYPQTLQILLSQKEVIKKLQQTGYKMGYKYRQNKSKYRDIDDRNRNRDSTNSFNVEDSIEPQSDGFGKVHLLPTLIEWSPSMFTSLDPLALPIQHIQQMIQQCKNGMQNPIKQVNDIRAQLKQFGNGIEKQLIQFNQSMVPRLKRLTQLLTSDRVVQHELKLRWRSDCIQLKEQDSNIRAQIEKQKERIHDLQDTIFECRPFQLKTSNGNINTMHQSIFRYQQQQKEYF